MRYGFVLIITTVCIVVSAAYARENSRSSIMQQEQPQHNVTLTTPASSGLEPLLPNNAAENTGTNNPPGVVETLPPVVNQMVGTPVYTVNDTAASVVNTMAYAVKTSTDTAATTGASTTSSVLDATTTMNSMQVPPTIVTPTDVPTNATSYTTAMAPTTTVLTNVTPYTNAMIPATTVPTNTSITTTTTSTEQSFSQTEGGTKPNVGPPTATQPLVSKNDTTADSKNENDGDSDSDDSDSNDVSSDDVSSDDVSSDDLNTYSDHSAKQHSTKKHPITERHPTTKITKSNESATLAPTSSLVLGVIDTNSGSSPANVSLLSVPEKMVVRPELPAAAEGPAQIAPVATTTITNSASSSPSIVPTLNNTSSG